MQIQWCQQSGYFNGGVVRLIPCKLMRGEGESWDSQRAIIHYQRKIIDAAINILWRLFHGLVGRDLTSQTHKKKSQNQAITYYTTNRGARTMTDTHPKGQMLPLGSVLGVWTQALGWQHNEVHHCASVVAFLAILWVSEAQTLIGSELAHIHIGWEPDTCHLFLDVHGKCWKLAYCCSKYCQIFLLLVAIPCIYF